MKTARAKPKNDARATILAAIKSRGGSIRAFATAAGVPYTTAYNFLRGNRDILWGNVEKLLGEAAKPAK